MLEAWDRPDDPSFRQSKEKIDCYHEDTHFGEATLLFYK
jgi:hypothetical protein